MRYPRKGYGPLSVRVAGFTCAHARKSLATPISRVGFWLDAAAVWQSGLQVAPLVRALCVVKQVLILDGLVIFLGWS